MIPTYQQEVIDDLRRRAKTGELVKKLETGRFSAEECAFIHREARKVYPLRKDAQRENAAAGGGSLRRPA